MKTNLILGIGTGRCGTLWLHDFIKAYIPHITSESCKLGWYYDGQFDLSIEPMKTWSKTEIACDVGFLTLPHIEKLSKYFNIKIIILKREKEATIKSFLNWTNIKHNYWINHKSDCFYERDGWDIYFPKFNDFEYREKRDVISEYYDYYYDLCNKLENKYDLLWIKTEDLDNLETQKDILMFLDIPITEIKNTECRKNSGFINK